MIVAAAEPGWVFAIDALTFVASAAFLSVLPIAATERPPRRPFLDELGEGCARAWSRGWMRAGLSLTAVTVLGISTFLVLGPVISQRDLGGATSWGAILAAGAVGGILGGAFALRLRPYRPLVAAFAAWSLSALPALALLLPSAHGAVAIAYGVFQAGIAFGNNMFETVLQREIPSHVLSRVDSFTWLVALGLSPSARRWRARRPMRSAPMRCWSRLRARGGLVRGRHLGAVRARDHALASGPRRFGLRSACINRVSVEDQAGLISLVTGVGEPPDSAEERFGLTSSENQGFPREASAKRVTRSRAPRPG